MIMEKSHLVEILDDILLPLSFKRKGNNWVLNGDELSKIVNLQKSNYGNAFYINYGYVIKGLELTTKEHVGSQLGSVDREEQKLITDCLNLESNISDADRISFLKKFIKKQIVSEMESTNTQQDLLRQIKKRPHINTIPLVVRRHFNLI
jgi:hypothetical protein